MDTGGQQPKSKLNHVRNGFYETLICMEDK